MKRFHLRKSSPTPKAPHPNAPSPKRGRGLTIRLKLTLWYGSLFLLAGVLLIAMNYFMVRDSLVPAPSEARTYVEEVFGLEAGLLDPQRQQDRPRGPQQIWISVDGELVTVPVPTLIAEAQNHLKDEALRQLWVWSLVALGVMTIITFGSAWLLAGRMLRPLRAITDTARRLSDSTLHERIALKGPGDELKDLADTFDDMLGRLGAAFSAQKEFVANASHELRTPLTIIRTELDVALSDPDLTPKELREMGEAVTEAVDRSERLIDGLLILASAERSSLLGEADLSEIARNEVALASEEAERMGLELEMDLRPTPIQGERALLERMVANLVENAIRHNVAGGWFSVKTWSDSQQALIDVANSGPVVPRKELQRLFDRFYRPDRSRDRKTGGFGLGLAIVKAVATAHDGTVTLDAPEAGGLSVRVALPLRQNPARQASEGLS